MRYQACARRAVPLALAAICAMSSGAPGATWTVAYDPAHPEDLVGAAVRNASSGDTILVGPGRYFEHIPISGKSLVFLSTDGSAATALDGGRDLPGTLGAILYTPDGVAADLTVRGFTFQNGRGAGNYGQEAMGGAICWWASGHAAVDISEWRSSTTRPERPLPASGARSVWSGPIRFGSPTVSSVAIPPTAGVAPST